MTETIVQAFVEHGAVGLLALITLSLYMKEKSEVRRLNALITQLQETHLGERLDTERSMWDTILSRQEEKILQIDEIRRNQTQRERELAETIQSIGASALAAIEKCDLIANELRRRHNEHP